MSGNGYSRPWSLGPFRPRFCARTVRGRVGVGILTFQSQPEAQRALEAALRHGRRRYIYLVFDNSEGRATERWMREAHPEVPYIHSFRNTGCWNARNRMLEFFASRGCEFAIFQDQDVVWAADAVPPMLAVFRAFPDTGCVTWRLAVDGGVVKGIHRWDKTGALWPPETPGMCCMFSIPALLSGKDPHLIGWYAGYGLCYRGDSDVCYSLWSKGYKTRITNGECAVRHVHPHRGVAKLGARLSAERAFSQHVFNERSRKYRWPALGG